MQHLLLPARCGTPIRGHIKMKFLGTEVKGMSTANSLREEKNEHPCSPLPKTGIEPGWVWLQQSNLTSNLTNWASPVLPIRGHSV
jgi:hypothetical protein